MKKATPNCWETRTCTQCGTEFVAYKSSPRVICDACNKIRKKKVQYEWIKKTYDRRSDKIFTRVCHDCGEPCCDYRCSECQTKHKKKYGVTVHVDETTYSGEEYGAM